MSRREEFDEIVNLFRIGQVRHAVNKANVNDFDSHDICGLVDYIDDELNDIELAVHVSKTFILSWCKHT